MSLASTSSESDDFLETCRASTLLAELEDDDELPEPDDNDDENEDDNEDDNDYEDPMVRVCYVRCTGPVKCYLMLFYGIVDTHPPLPTLITLNHHNDFFWNFNTHPPSRNGNNVEPS